MQSTIALALESVLTQLDEKYEVIVVDDGSDDKSVDTLLDMKRKFNNLRVIPLIRDSRRKLGETRNVSIRAARGKYVLLHIDGDDVWEPYIDSFVRIYHEIENRLSYQDFMLSGLQIQMATRSLLINHPYPNVYYVEDRLLWTSLAVLGRLVSVNHVVFRKRIPLVSRRSKLLKVMSSQFSSITAAFSFSPNPSSTFVAYLRRVFFDINVSLNLSLITFILLIPAYINGIFFKRHKLFNQCLTNYRELTMIDLAHLEEITRNELGSFNLNMEERKIYYLK